MNKRSLLINVVLIASALCLKVEAASVFGQGKAWNLQFADNALAEFNALEADPAWVAQLDALPDNTWLKTNPLGIPALHARFRSEVPMVYMPEFNTMFFTAGDAEEFGSYNSDSWAYSLSANTWVQMWPNYIKNLPFNPANPFHNQEPYPSDRPAGRCSMGLGFDTDRGVLVLRGGANTGSQGRFTWEYDLATNRWEKTAPRENGYPRAEDNNLGFIPGFGTVEVGGDRNTIESETWVYQSNVTGWEKITTNGAPPGAHNSRMVWASGQQRLIYWGASSQLWAFDPVTSTWENISPTSGPSPAGFGRNGMAYDSANDVIIMYGNDSTGALSHGPWVYSFESQVWQDMNPSFEPGGGFGRQQSQHMAYDIEHNVVVITGNGRGTWVYRYKQAGPRVAIPRFSPSGGTFALSAEVTLSSETQAASIRFTTDGSRPTVSSALYSTPFTLTETTTVKAIAYQDQLESIMASATFRITGPDLTPPTLVSTSANNSTTVSVVFSEAVTAASAEASVNYQIDGGIQLLSATLDADQQTVYLTTSSLVVDQVYTLTVSNIEDTSIAANEISPGSSVEFTYVSAMGFDNGQLPFNWTPFTPSRWSIEPVNGDNALFLNTTNYSSEPGLRLGEYITSPDSYADFSLKVDAKSDEPAGNTNADYALVFGFQNANNYYYMLFNKTLVNTKLSVVVDDERTDLATASQGLTGNDYNAVEVRRLGDTIEVWFEGNMVLQVIDTTYMTGRVGLGSFNDSAYFDNIRVTGGIAGQVEMTFMDGFE